jgi:xylulokinase
VEEACKSVIKVVSTTKADSGTKSVYDQFYPIYRSLYSSVKNEFDAVAKVVSE